MALQVGSKAPDFTLPATGGLSFTLSQEAAGQAVILYFYPKDFTPGCTAEACDFRDNIAQFSDLSIPVFGISRDSVLTHEKFKEKYQLPFALLADESGRVAKAYQALIPLIGLTKRITYLLDKNHQIAAVYESMFGAKQHIKAMIAQLNLVG
ncbi:MAG: peroxiredoxin [Microscillaceae bacterium]|nr:peroxiredoxin [Microscillaceae bacterium]